MQVILITCGTTLLLTCAAYFWYQYYSFTNNYLLELSNRGKIIAANSTAALAFENRNDAQEILSSLNADPHIVAVALYDRDRRLFSKYPPDLPSNAIPASPMFNGFRLGESGFEGFQPVILENKQIGTLYLKADLDVMYDMFRYYTLIALSLLVIALVFAYVLARALNRGIYKPIVALADTSKAISEKHDYSIRAEKFTNDELGILTDNFNQMVSQIQTQNEEITTFNQKLEEKIADRTNQLEAANKELESFSYSVSHDLRAPLRTMNIYSKMLEEDYGNRLDEKGMHLLNVVQKNMDRMGKLIDELLNFSRMGRAALSKADTDINAIVNKVIESLKMADPEIKAEIIVKDLPWCYCDPALMEQVWQNLISNAIKYSRKKEHPVIEIGATQKGRQIQYYIKDNGVGFEMEYAGKLFQVFQRLHETKEFEGTGIGLALVQRILEKHGGKIWADATPNVGATFYFTVPASSTNKGMKSRGADTTQTV